MTSPFAHGTSSYGEEKEPREHWDREEYEFHQPWEESPSQAVRDHERDLLAESYSVRPPWIKAEKDEEYSRSLTDRAARDGGVKHYKFVPLHAPLEMTSAQLKRMKDHKTVPPFRTEDNYDPLIDKCLMRKHVVDEHRISLAPWLQGREAHPIIPHKKIAPARSTAIWDAPKAQPTTLESTDNPVLDKLRRQLKAFGASGILGLSKKFKIIDDDRSGKLSLEEFRKGLRECRVELSAVESANLFGHFDKDDSGDISYDEFLIGVRGVLTRRRKSMVEMAFAKLDRDKSGFATIEDIANVYDTSSHPDVVGGKKQPQDILLEFLDTFDVGGTKDGIVSSEEFINYYANVSASIDNDDYFELMMRNAWHISGGEGSSANTANKRVLVTGKDGRQSVQEANSNPVESKRNSTSMNERRLKVVTLAYDRLDRDGSGLVSLGDMKVNFNAKKHPDVKSYKKSPEAVFARVSGCIRIQKGKCLSE